MNKLDFAAATGGALAALALAFPAGAAAAPLGVGSAEDTVNTLESNGFKVILHKVGGVPLDQCTVDSVRPGETVTRAIHGENDMVSQIVYQTVYLTANC
jgi:hypothetical protein